MAAAEVDGKSYIIVDEGTMADFLLAGDPSDAEVLSRLITVMEFESHDERDSKLAEIVAEHDATRGSRPLLAPLMPPARSGGWPHSVGIRGIPHGLFSILCSGCAWRYLPREYGPWQTVYWYFRQWCLGGMWALIHGCASRSTST